MSPLHDEWAPLGSKRESIQDKFFLEKQPIVFGISLRVGGFQYCTCTVTDFIHTETWSQ